MRVSRRSWHYRVWIWGRYTRDVVPTNLCPYFWNIVGRLVLCLAGVVSLAAAGTTIGLLLYTAFRYHTWDALLVVAGFAFVALVLVGLVWLERRPRRPRPVTPPGLVSSWIRAKKARVCPRIELVD